MAAAERRARWVPLVAAVLAAALGVALGAWQLSRAHEKQALQQRYEALARDPPISVTAGELHAADVELRRVTAHGRFDPDHAVYLDNRVMDGVPGYQVVMPLELGAGRYVLVNRGWVAGSPGRLQLPEVATPQTAVDVTGIAVVPVKRPFELSSEVVDGRVWQNLTLERYRQVRKLAIQPFVIRQDNALDDGLVRRWEPPDYGVERHYGYAVQWFLLAATAIGFWGVTRVRRNRKTG